MSSYYDIGNINIPTYSIECENNKPAIFLYIGIACVVGLLTIKKISDENKRYNKNGIS